MRVLQTPQVEASLLIELISGIQYGAGSEVPFAFKDSIATHIIAFYGLKMSSWDALRRDSVRHKHMLEHSASGAGPGFHSQ